MEALFFGDVAAVFFLSLWHFRVISIYVIYKHVVALWEQQQPTGDTRLYALESRTQLALVFDLIQALLFIQQALRMSLNVSYQPSEQHVSSLWSQTANKQNK